MIVTIIPAKPFHESKKRLAPVLSLQQRVPLSQRMLAHTILVASQLSRVVVVSRSAAVRRMATKLGVHALAEKQADLNVAIRQGIAWAQTQGSSGVLILPLDLPLLSRAVLEDFVHLGWQHSPRIIIAPCRHQQGTNALFLSPPTVISPQFGPSSFVEHQNLARHAGILPQIYHAPELASDLDTPEDWLALKTLDPLFAENLFVSLYV
jgi:2-phospho-L-lactate guanylyltransferase